MYCWLVELWEVVNMGVGPLRGGNNILEPKRLLPYSRICRQNNQYVYDLRSRSAPNTMPWAWTLKKLNCYWICSKDKAGLEEIKWYLQKPYRWQLSISKFDSIWPSSNLHLDHHPAGTRWKRTDWHRPPGKHAGENTVYLGPVCDSGFGDPELTELCL